MKEIQVNSAIKDVLTSVGCKYVELVTPKINKENLIVTEDGKVIGIDEQIKNLKENYKELFGPLVTGVGDPDEGIPNGSVKKNPWSKEYFNLTEQARIFKTNPELAAQLMNQSK